MTIIGPRVADFSDLDHIRFKWIFLSDINVVWVTNLLRHICLIQACSTKVVFNSPKYYKKHWELEVLFSIFSNCSGYKSVVHFKR